MNMSTMTTYSGAITLDNGTEAYCGAEGCRVFCDGGASVSVKFGGWYVVFSMNSPTEILSTRILRSPYPRMGGDSARAHANNASAERREVAMAAMIQKAALAKAVEIGAQHWPEVYAAA